MRRGGLVRGCQRDAPRAGAELARKQLGRHGGLAMRCKLHAVLAHEAAHPFQVVRKPVFIEHRGRQAQLFLQQAPAGAGGVRCQRGFQAPQRLVERIDHASLILYFTHACHHPEKI
ncbi:hypothetical protein D9M72_616130 [compost metagenome]